MLSFHVSCRDRRAFLTLSALGAAAAACSSNNTPSTGPGPSSVTVQIVPASPDAGAVSVYVSPTASTTKLGTSVAANAGYLSTTKVTPTSNSSFYQFTKTGATTILAQDGTVSLLPKTTYDVVVFDSLAGGTTPSYFAQLLPNLVADTTAANAHLRLIDALPTPAAVDVYVTAPATPLPGSTPLCTAMTPGLNTSSAACGAPSNSYVSEAAGSYEIRVTPTGDTTAADMLVDATVALTAGQVVSEVAAYVTPGVAGLFAVTDK